MKRKLAVLSGAAVLLASLTLRRPLDEESYPVELCRQRAAPSASLENQCNVTSPECSNDILGLLEGLLVEGTSARPKLSPPWLKKSLYKKGQEFARSNLALLSFCQYVALILVAGCKYTTKLMVAHGNSHTVERALPRYIVTGTQIWLWYEYELESDENRIIQQSISNVRSLHKSVFADYPTLDSVEAGLDKLNARRNWSINEELWDALAMDLEASDIPQELRKYPETALEFEQDPRAVHMNQFFMGAAQYLFVAVPFVYTDILDLMSPTPEELQGWNHLWAALGYALGIEDKYNVALQPNSGAIKRFYDDWFKVYMIPGLFHLQTESKVYAETLLEVSNNWPIFDLLTPNLFLTIIIQDVIKIPTNNLEQLLTPLEKLKLVVFKVAKQLGKFLPIQPILKLLNILAKAGAENLGRKWYPGIVYSDDEMSKHMFY